MWSAAANSSFEGDGQYPTDAAREGTGGQSLRPEAQRVVVIRSKVKTTDKVERQKVGSWEREREIERKIKLLRRYKRTQAALTMRRVGTAGWRSDVYCMSHSKQEHSEGRSCVRSSVR
jgi:hypothetical protein